MQTYTFKEIVASLPPKKNSRSSIWVKIVVRKISFLFTYVFVNCGISPWLASVISAITAFAGSLLFSIDSNICRIIGLVFIQLWLVLDCVDGNIARVTKKCSDMGDFIDTLSGYVISAFSMLSIGIAAYHTSTIFNKSVILIILGGVGSIGNILARLVHQNYMVTVLRLEKKGVFINNPDDNVECDRGLDYIRSRFDKEIGISGFFMPLLILALILKRLDVFTIFYCIFFGLSCVVICIYYALKSKL